LFNGNTAFVATVTRFLGYRIDTNAFSSGGSSGLHWGRKANSDLQDPPAGSELRSKREGREEKREE